MEGLKFSYTRDHRSLSDDKSKYETTSAGNQGTKVKHLWLTVICDVSKSMSGQKMQQVNQSIKVIFKTLIKSEEDKMQIITFGTNVKIHFPLISPSSISNKLLQLQVEGDNIALYDAIAQGLKCYSTAGNNIQQEFLVITDGDDNASRESFDSVKKQLEEMKSKNNFGFTMIGVDLSGREKHKLNEMCKKKYCKFMDCNDNRQEIVKTLNNVKEHISQITYQKDRKKVDVKSHSRLVIEGDLSVHSLASVLEHVTGNTGGKFAKPGQCKYWPNCKFTDSACKFTHPTAGAVPQSPIIGMPPPPPYQAAHASQPTSKPITKPVIKRCKFTPTCTRKNCEFFHPKKKCPKWPKCQPSVEECTYLHKKCVSSAPFGCYKNGCPSKDHIWYD